MLKSVKSILFATDLTKNCQPALDFTLSMATVFKAKIYMLHVIERLPENVDERLKDLLGGHQWDELLKSHKTHARKSLLGKQSTNSVIREAIHNFCQQEGLEIDPSKFEAHEIVVSDGDVVEDILKYSKLHECDLITIGGNHSTLFSKTAMSSTAKGVLKKSVIPVTIVPATDS
jgi:nucleotide-binding universal stress UspA family protein